jgi:DNA-binding beta-propeller fold protein YncE
VFDQALGFLELSSRPNPSGHALVRQEGLTYQSMMRFASLVLAVATACGPPPSTTPKWPSVVTIAGKNAETFGFRDGTGTDALFAGPEGIAYDEKRNALYVADPANHALRRVDLATMEVTTIAGVGGKAGSNDTLPDGGRAHLSWPRSVVLHPREDALYFTDTGNRTIRRLDLATMTVTTSFGTAGQAGTTDGVGRDARFGTSSPFMFWSGGLTLDVERDQLYVADSANQTLRAMDLKTRAVSTLIGKPGVLGFQDGAHDVATLNKPTGLALDGKGGLYVGDANSLTLRRVDLASRTISTVGGKAPADVNTFCEVISPTLPPECEWIDGPVATSRYRFPFDLLPRGTKGLFVVDAHNNVIRDLDYATNTVTTVAGTQRTILDDFPHASTESSDTEPGTFWHPTHAVFRPPNTLYVSDRAANCIRQVELR